MSVMLDQLLEKVRHLRQVRPRAGRSQVSWMPWILRVSDGFRDAIARISAIGCRRHR